MSMKRISTHSRRNAAAIISVMIHGLSSGLSLAEDGRPAPNPDNGSHRAQAKPESARHDGRKTARGERRCPRALWKDDPVCFDAPDEHTLPTPSSTGPTTAHKGSSNHAATPVAENVEAGVKWDASNNPLQHGYDSIPMIGSVRRGVYGSDDNWGGGGPDTHVGAGVNLKF